MIVSLLQCVDLLHIVQYAWDAGFLNMASQENLVHDDVAHSKVEYQIQLGDDTKVLVHSFHKEMDRLNHRQLIIT